VDVVATVAIIAWVLKKRGMLGMLTTSLTQLRAFSESVKTVTADYLSSNYSGNPDSLPVVLEGLLTQLDQLAQQQGLTMDRNALKMVLLRALQSQSNVSTGDAMAALKKVA